MPRIGLVLGAGGLVGQAYEIGVLAALEWDLGWEAASADVVVGTSAGALAGALVGLGVPTLELAGWALGRPQDGDALLEELARLRDALPGIDARVLLHRWHPPSRDFWSRAVTRPWSLRPVPTLTAMLPTGTLSLAELAGERLWELASRRWPPALRICATRRGDGALVVFGAPATSPPPLVTAVAASCAIPAYFAPVLVDGVQHLDGGLRSPTNANVAAQEGLDLAIVVSPLSGAPGPLRGRFRRRLEAECATLRAAGTEVVCFAPGPRAAAAMGLNPMAQDRAGAVLPAAFFETGAAIARSELRDALSVIRSRPAPGQRAA